MIYKFRRLHLLVLILLISACSTNEDPESLEEVGAAENNGLYVAEVCDGENRGGRDETLRSARPDQTHGYEDVCVNNVQRVRFNPDVTRIYLMSEDDSYIKFECESSVEYGKYMRSLGEQGELALVANSRVISVFRYFDKGELAENCGRIHHMDFYEALDTCEHVRLAMGEEPDACSSMCNMKEDVKLRNVCVVVNSTS